MKILFPALLIALFALPAMSADEPPTRSQFVLDDQVWVLFYDLPSRRFRTIRDAFVAGQFDTARRDLEVSAGFVQAESARAEPALAAPLSEISERLQALADGIDNPETTVRDLDPVFARAHWLLAQHYLTRATFARDAGQHKNAGNYLRATAHHLERTVLWSDARIDKKLQKALDGMRDLAEQLRTSAQPEQVYKQKPIDNARRTLFELGQFLDRKVWIAPAPM